MMAFLLTLSLVACGGSSSSNGTASTTSETSASDDSSPLVVAVNQDFETLHPVNYSRSVEKDLINQIYDTLAIDDPDDPAGDMISRLAESWEISDDECCYTFHLRQGVKFHDGSEVTAEDVGFSLDLCQASEYQGTLVDGMDHWEIVDDYTINVYTTTPYAPFLRSVVDVPIASKAYYESVDESEFAQNPMGCGPYKFVSHKLGDSVVLEAFEDYYGGAPEIKNVTFKVLADAASISIGLRSGDLHFAEVEASVLNTLEEDPNVEIETAKQTGFYFIAMNTEKEPYNNVTFRQAINYAIDREALVEAVLEGQGEVNSNLLTPEREGYSESEKQYGYDPELAKSLLAECGYPDGIDLGKLMVADRYKLMAQVIQSDLAKVGVTVELEIVEFNVYMDKLGDGDFGITCMRISFDGDTQQLALALRKDYVGYANSARWYDQKVEDLFDKAAVTVNDEERVAIYEEIFTYVQDQAVYCVLCNPSMLFAKRVGLETGTLVLEGYYYLQNFHWVS